MNDLALSCPICKRKTMRQSYTIYSVCCRRKVHRNCTVLSPDEFALARNNSHWYHRLCNENIPAFNHIENDSEFQQALHEFDTSLTLDLKINDDNNHIVEYEGELDPDKNYFNQFSYHLSQRSNYYSEDSFHKCVDRCNNGNDIFSIIHLNIRSLPANMTGFISYLSNINHTFSVIGFTETWLKPSNIETFGITGYNHVGFTKQNGKCGGVSLFISDDIVFSELQELSMEQDHIECIFIKINIMGHTYLKGLVSWPPNSNITEFSNAIHYILDKIASKPCYMMGDYNLDHLKHDIHHPTENSLDIMYANYLVPLINRPTRITRASSTRIDNIFSNNYNVIDYQINRILKTDISDHYILLNVFPATFSDTRCSQWPGDTGAWPVGVYEVLRLKTTNDQYKIVRVIDTSRTQRYFEKIRTLDWSILESYNECQTYFSNFLSYLKTSMVNAFQWQKLKHNLKTAYHG